VLSTNGDTHLGGDDIDNLFMPRLQQEAVDFHEFDIAQYPEFVQELRQRSLQPNTSSLQRITP